MGSQPVAVAEQMREPQLVLNGQDGRFARIRRGEPADGWLHAGRQLADLLAGGLDDDGRPARGDAAGQAIVAALGNVRGFSIAGDQLTLTDQFGQPLIRAVAVALRADGQGRHTGSLQGARTGRAAAALTL